MKLRMFSVYDERAKAFIPPFFLPMDAMAVREFSDCVNDPRHAFGKHPEDYKLFHVGEFDVETGGVSSEPQAPRLVVLGVAVLSVKEVQT